MAAFLAPILVAVKAYLAKNAIAAGIHAVPYVAFVTVFAVQWATGSVLGHIQAIALVIATAVLTLILTGKVPAISLPVLPVVTPAKPVVVVDPKVLPLP